MHPLSLVACRRDSSKTKDLTPLQLRSTKKTGARAKYNSYGHGHLKRDRNQRILYYVSMLGLVHVFHAQNSRSSKLSRESGFAR